MGYRWWLIVLAFVVSPVLAEWSLVGEESVLAFISTKKGDVAEVHTFSKLSGNVKKSGQLVINIDLASVETQVSVRDDRMREMLFETVSFPSAKLTALLDRSVLQELKVGQSKAVNTEATLELHGQRKRITVDALVVRPSQTELVVASLKPVIVNAAEFGLTEGVEKLRAVVGLPSISLAVPVSFVLKFSR